MEARVSRLSAMTMGIPGTPDGPPADDPTMLGTDALTDRRRLAETILAASADAVSLLAEIVRDPGEETRERRMAAQALLGLSGVANVAGRTGPGGSGTDPIDGLLSLLDGRPRSRWAASATGRERCPEPSCDWPAHRGGDLAHGHTVEAGYPDGCGFRHSMMAPCGPVPEGGSTRSDFWESRAS